LWQLLVRHSFLFVSCLQAAPESGGDESNHQAKLYYRKVLAIDPLHHEAWYNLGYVQEELEEFSAAIVSFNKALEVTFKLCPSPVPWSIELFPVILHSCPISRFLLSLHQ